MPVPAAVFPTALDSLTNPTLTTNRDDPGFELHGVVGRIQDILEALEAKLGIGASTPAAGGGVLRQTASGTSAWGQAVAADIGSGAVTTAKLAAEAAAQLRYAASFGAQSTSSTTYTGIPASSVAFPCTGKPVLVLMTLTGFRLTSGTSSASVVLRDTSVGTDIMLLVDDNAGTAYNSKAGIGIFTPAAGTKTFALYWLTSSGTINASNGSLALLELK